MKLVTYTSKNTVGRYRIGAIQNNEVIDLNEVYRQLLISEGKTDAAKAVDMILPPLPDSFYSLGKVAIERSVEALQFKLSQQLDRGVFDQNAVILGPPVPNPSKIICVGVNYKDHVKEMGRELPEFPVLFAKFSNAIIGPADNIPKSPLTNMLDYEAELAVVIGKETSHVKKESALNYVAGYTIANDVTARDLQRRTPQWLQGKSLDGSAPMGPSLVTSDEINDPGNLSIATFVNGEKRQASNTKQLIFDVPYLIEFISSLITLQPGDVIMTGTPHGVGFAMDPQQFLQDGDTVKIEIDKIGSLQNKIKSVKE